MAGIIKCDQVQSDSNLAFNIAGSNVAFMNATSLQMVGSNVSLAGTNVITNGRVVTSGMPLGSVLQVVQTQLTTHQTFSPGAGVFTDITGATASITPSSASNKILVTYSTFMSTTQGTPSWFQYLRILRNGTAVGVGTQASFKSVGAANYAVSRQYGGPLVQTFLDSPATTSTVTYQLSGAGEDAFSIGGSYASGASNPSIPTTIILMEIAA